MELLLALQEEQLALAVHLASEFARPAENQASEFARNARPVRHSEAPSAPVDEHDTNIQDPEVSQLRLLKLNAQEDWLCCVLATLSRGADVERSLP